MAGTAYTQQKIGKDSAIFSRIGEVKFPLLVQSEAQKSEGPVTYFKPKRIIWSDKISWLP